mmetsp:Transcript_23938/g.77023  ORF Transcript_23938/g.77023 Transcript_23938/m.77023 type:complete len:644 (+) Transcript_23938:71-2002(+)
MMVAAADDCQEEEEDHCEKLRRSFSLGEDGPALTFRACAVGTVVGFALCASNLYFGLQSGWTTMGSIQAAMIGNRVLASMGQGAAGAAETVVAQTVAVSAATMPIAGGFVGVVPALSVVSPSLLGTWRSQLVWTGGLAFFGVFLAAPLRRRLILKDRLEFPSGTATAALVKVLHRDGFGEIVWLLRSFGMAFLYGLASFLSPRLSKLPIFGYSAARWGWVLCPSPAYAAQGALMGPSAGASMLLGAVLGFGVVAPLVSYARWSPSAEPEDTDGPKSYALWLSVALMLGDSVVTLGAQCLTETLKKKADTQKKKGTTTTEAGALLAGRTTSSLSSSEQDDASSEDSSSSSEDSGGGVPARLWVPGLVLSVAGSVGALVFASKLLTLSQALLAVACAGLVSYLAVRALGSTDLNPVSAVGKVSQVVFALAAPKNVVANLAAGAVAEAGAAQAGDMMQDLKTGYLVGVDPTDQFVAQIIGSALSVFFTVALYRLYSSVFVIPSADFPAPTASIWLDFAELCAHGGALDGYRFLEATCALAFFLGAALALPETFRQRAEGKKTPTTTTTILRISPVALAIGLYLSPRFSLPRVVGAFGAEVWRRRHPASHRQLFLVVASGFVLGEGIASIVTAAAAGLLQAAASNRV